MVVSPHHRHQTLRNLVVETPWSPNIVITEVLLTFQSDLQTFYGVKTANMEFNFWGWPETDGLLWVFDRGGQLKVWQEHQQGPYIPPGRPAYEIEHVIGYHESETGSTYVGVKWKGYESPTWELEADVDRLLGWNIKEPSGLVLPKFHIEVQA